MPPVCVFLTGLCNKHEENIIFHDAVILHCSMLELKKQYTGVFLIRVSSDGRIGGRPGLLYGNRRESPHREKKNEEEMKRMTRNTVWALAALREQSVHGAGCFEMPGSGGSGRLVYRPRRGRDHADEGQAGQKKATMTSGEKLTLKLTCEPSGAKPIRVDWWSSNEAVATVSSEGLATAVGKGTAIITVYRSDDGS